MEVLSPSIFLNPIGNPRSEFPESKPQTEETPQTDETKVENMTNNPSSDRHAFLAKLRNIAVSASPNFVESEESWFTDEFESLQAALAMSRDEIDSLVSDVQIGKQPKHEKLKAVDIPLDAKELRIMCEKNRKLAELKSKQNPIDSDNLTIWAEALLELACFEDGKDAEMKMVKDAISKLEMVLMLHPKKHEALWALGNAYTTQGLLCSDIDIAVAYFEKAAKCYKNAVDEDPSNEVYIYSLKMNSKAAEVHMETQKHRQILHDRLREEGHFTSSYAKGSEEEKESGYSDIYGWGMAGIFAAALVALPALVFRARSS